MRRVLLFAAVGLTGCNARVAERPAAEVPAVAVAVAPAPEVTPEPVAEALAPKVVTHAPTPAPRVAVAPAPRVAVRTAADASNARVAGAESSMPRSEVAAGASKTLPRPPAGEPAPAPKPEPRPEPPPVVEPVVAAVAERDMEDVRLLIDTASGASGVMPSKALTREALAAAGSPAAELVKQKAIVLTGATSRESVWAYEAAAVARGGLVAGPGGVETVTAEELRRRLDAR